MIKKKSSKAISKSAPIYFKDANVDATTGVIKDIVVVQGGKDKYGDNFDSTFLEQIIEQGNAQKQGVKSRFGHPNMCDTTLGSFIGRYKNFRLGASGERDVVLADLYLDPIAKNSPKGNLYDYTITMSQKNDDMFGNSIVYIPDMPEYKKEHTEESDTEVEVPYERLKSFLASDLVDSPAATESLFKDSEDLAAKVTEFLEENPSIYDIISKDESVLAEFLVKYKEFKSNKTIMTKIKKKKFIEEVKELIGAEAKSYQTETADGKTINIDNPSGSGTPEVGDKVTDDQDAPVVSQTLTLKDGTSITTDAEGIITNVTPAAEEDKEKKDDNKKETEKDEVSKLKEENKNLKKELDEFKAEQKEEREAVMKEIRGLKAQVKSTHVPPTGETKLGRQQDKGKGNRISSLRDQRKEAREKEDKK
jgi:hypothetical protein